MAKHRLSCNKCGHTWQVSSQELAGGLVSCPGCQVVGTAAPKSDCSPKEEGYFKITERESPQKSRWKSPQSEQNGNYEWLIPIVLVVGFILRTDSGCRKTLFSFFNGESQQGVEATASSGNISTTRPKQEPAASPAVQASAEQKKDELVEMAAKRIVLGHYQNMSRAVDLLADIRAGFSTGINRIEYNRLLRELHSEVIKREDDIGFLLVHKDPFAQSFQVACMMGEAVDGQWEVVQETDRTQSAEGDYPQKLMKVFPSTKKAVVWGYVYRDAEGWIMNMKDALSYAMNDTTERLRETTRLYKSGLQFYGN